MKIFNWCCVFTLICMLVWLWFTIAKLEQMGREKSTIKKSSIIFEAKEYDTEKEIWEVDLQ